jgi:hypothetical protein
VTPEHRCADCVAEAVAALDDADWIIAAGGDPYSDAVIHDQAVACVWFDVAYAHSGEVPR